MGQGKKTEEELDNLGRRLQKNERIIKKNDAKIVKFEASDSPKAPLRAKRFQYNIGFNQDLNIKDCNESEIPISNKRIKNVSPTSYSQKLMEVKAAQPVVTSSPKMLHYPSRKQEQAVAVIKVSKLLNMQRNDNFPAKNRPHLQIASIRRESSRSPGHSPRDFSYDSNLGEF